MSSTYVAAGIFILFTLITLGITIYASRRGASISSFYAAGGHVSGVGNGLAIAGDFISAATFLGLTGLTFVFGADMLIFGIGTTIGWALVLFLIAEPLRSMGRYTFAEAVSHRLSKGPISIFAAIGVLVVSIPYLIAQIVGSGALVETLFGIDYRLAVVVAGVLLTLYVVIGGMVAATWIQMIKAGLLIGSGIFLCGLTLGAFDFDISRLIEEAEAGHALGDRLLSPGNYFSDPGAAFSLGLALSLGLAGFPHLMMRFFTVESVKAARLSAVIAIGINAVFMLIVFIIGLGAISLLAGSDTFLDTDGRLIGGPNMVVVHLSEHLGGAVFYGFISAVAFATILAVVAGLTIAIASAVSHDLYAQTIRKGRASEVEELAVSRAAVVVTGVVTVLLGFLFEGQNVAVLAAVATSIAAAVNFPVLLLAIYWPRLTTWGAVCGGGVGLAASVAAIVLGPDVWVRTLGHAAPIFPYSYPTLLALPAAFAAAIGVSLLDPTPRGRMERQGSTGAIMADAGAPK